MSEVADMILDGTLCQKCGGFAGEAVGFPRDCGDCRRENNTGRWATMIPNPLGRKKVNILRVLRDGNKPWREFGTHRESLLLMGYIGKTGEVAGITPAGLAALERYEQEHLPSGAERRAETSTPPDAKEEKT